MDASQIAPNVWQLDHASGEQPYMAMWQCASQRLVRFFDQADEAKSFASNGRVEGN